jgi:hypothetical protein
MSNDMKSQGGVTGTGTGTGTIRFAVSKQPGALAADLPMRALGFHPYGHEWATGQRVVLPVQAATFAEFTEYVLRHADKSDGYRPEEDPYTKGICVAKTIDEVARNDDDIKMLSRLGTSDVLYELVHVASTLSMDRLLGELLSVLVVRYRDFKTMETLSLQLLKEAAGWKRGILVWKTQRSDDGWYEAVWKK